MGMTPLDSMAIELSRLDVLLRREILRLRASYQLSLDEFRGLYISDEQVDQLVRKKQAEENPIPAAEELLAAADDQRELANARESLPWRLLAERFELNPVERDFLIVAVAPEFDAKYETIYAYLNNDVTRKWPTVDLALRLAGRTHRERLELAVAIRPGSRLFSSGLLQPLTASADRSSWLSTGFRPAPHLASFLRGERVVDPRLAGICQFKAETEKTDWEKLPVSSGTRENLRGLGRLLETKRTPILVFLGRPGSGQREAAGAVSTSLGFPLLQANLLAGAGRSDLGQLLGLQCRLYHAGLYLHEAETLFEREGSPTSEGRRLLQSLAGSGLPVFLELAPGSDWRSLLQDLPALPFSFDDLDQSDRLRLWREEIEQAGIPLADDHLESLADRFMLSAGQIREAVRLAVSYRALQAGEAEEQLVESLLRAARDVSGQGLGRLAVKLEPIYTWEELVLPATTLRQVREVAAAIRNYRLVYEQWGFRKRLSSGQGLKVLFSGASGTGKTMTASVIARDLGLDIYKIDLSSVVSKYIGETEKNLERIFRAAESSNSILFFDEADALFGKRSEVKDAHDRYANVEVAYLLQRIEDQRGVVILASNLSQNIDDAFSRRMHYVIEFPLPDEEHRAELWRGMFPASAPLGEDVDFTFLARQFAIPGGDIRNVSLEAAFLAAQDGRVIRMHHLVRAMARQMLKQGKLPSPADFKQHYALTAEE